MENNIVLSICIASYNRRDLVCKNVKKILRYEGDDIEVIVNDNASEDGTVEALKKIDDNRLRIYQNEINVGIVGNQVRVTRYATGQYMMIINDRDWVEPENIQDFILTYKDRGCDFIIAADGYKRFKKNYKQLEGRAFLYWYCDHPGNHILGKAIYNELALMAKDKEVNEYTHEWMGDVMSRRLSLCIYAGEWEYFKKIVRQPRADQQAEIKQLRGQSYSERLFFTFEGRIEQFRTAIDSSSYIQSNDMEMYIRGLYRRGALCMLWEYYHIRRDPYIRSYLIKRYQWEPEPSVCWIKLAIRFYKKSIEILRQKGLYTRHLALNLALITAWGYILIYWKRAANMLTNVKRRFFPKL